MANEFKKIMISFLLAGLFMVLIVNAIYGLSATYGVDADSVNEATAGSLDVSAYEQELATVHEDTSDLRSRFESGKVDNVDDASGVFSVSGDITGVITTPFNLVAKVGSNILGIPEFVTKVILAVVNIVLLLGLWSVLRSGQ